MGMYVGDNIQIMYSLRDKPFLHDLGVINSITNFIFPRTAPKAKEHDINNSKHLTSYCQTLPTTNGEW